MKVDEPEIRAQKLSEGAVVADRYEVICHVADGGMASVYRARDLKGILKNELALKILHSSLAEDETHLERFIQEAQVLSQIHHPAVIELLDVGEYLDLVYICMPFVGTPTLAHLIETNTLEHIYLKTLLRSLCEGVQAIHEAGIIHRDLKPANILVLPDSTVKITDFGIARFKQSRLTSAQQKVGSLPYIPPEAWMGEQPTISFDMYSLGVCMYELLTGENPFYSPLPAQIMKLHLGPLPPPPSSITPGIPGWADDLTLWLLAKKAKHRPSSALKILSFLKNGDFKNNKHPTLMHQQRSSPEVMPQRNKTYIMSLTPGALSVSNKSLSAAERPYHPHSKTVSIALPKNSAFVFNFTPPSRDVVTAGILLASLQTLDGYLTSLGIAHWGIEKEGNGLLRSFMEVVGADNALIIAKTFAILAVILLTMVARRHREYKPVINILSFIYICMAIVPWVIILSRENKIPSFF